MEDRSARKLTYSLLDERIVFVCTVIVNNYKAERKYRILLTLK